MWDKYQRWPVYSKFFDNMGPIPHHMHQSAKQAKLVGQEGKPESYYFPPQLYNHLAASHWDHWGTQIVERGDLPIDLTRTR